VEKKKLEIVIDNLTEAQAIAIEDMLRQWEMLASWGSSRWTAFYADGDGNFRPKIMVNGTRPEHTKLLKPEERANKVTVNQVPLDKEGNIPTSCDYAVDFDTIAWRLREQKSSETVL